MSSYVDSRGRRQRLTPEQANYLDAGQRGFTQGWGGLSSTLTVRILRERGLILLDDRTTPWRVTRLTTLGEQVLQSWRDASGAAT